MREYVAVAAESLMTVYVDRANKFVGRLHRIRYLQVFERAGGPRA